MRPIKFRVWDGNNKEWRTDFVIKDDGTIWNEKLGEPFYWKLMQFTGLIDKNFVEIFEGDIVTGHTSYELDNDDFDFQEKPTEVKWNEKYAGFFPFTMNQRWRCDVVNVEVIGNCFENPELLAPIK